MTNHFDILNNYINKNMKEEKNKKEPDTCNHKFQQDINQNVCVLCGLVKSEIIYQDTYGMNNYYTSYNNYNKNNTLIGQSNKTTNKSILRLHIWINNNEKINNSVNFRKECKNYIENIIDRNNVPKWIQSKVIADLNKLYCDENLRIRNNIKVCLFLFLIFVNCIENNIDFDLIKNMEQEKLTIKNYNDLIKKIKDYNIKNTYYIPTNFDVLIDYLKKYNKHISLLYCLECYEKLIDMDLKINKINLGKVLIYYIIKDKKLLEEFDFKKNILSKIKNIL